MAGSGDSSLDSRIQIENSRKHPKTVTIAALILKALAVALRQIAAKCGKSYATHATRKRPRISLQVIEKIGGPGGVRTLDLMTARHVRVVPGVDSKGP